jgi:hypothetical protein
MSGGLVAPRHCTGARGHRRSIGRCTAIGRGCVRLRHRRAGNFGGRGDVARAACPPRCALRARRHHRPRGALGRARFGGAAGTAPHHREPARRRCHARQRHRGRGDARRPHAGPVQRGEPRDRADALRQPALRPAQGLRAHRAHHGEPFGLRRQPGLRRARPAGRGAAGERRDARTRRRFLRLRLVQPPADRASRAGDGGATQRRRRDSTTCPTAARAPP